ncbi:MAG: sigma 54-interacting transcriptional regulator [Bacteroidetes bacterium]|nr:sigma 54-interacting transcriptional regulator [Bacteroidota bacterium]
MGELEFDDNGTLIRMVGTIQDITERKETENALKLSEKKFKDLFNKSSDALLIIKNNIFIDCNIATCKMLGYATKNEFLNVHPSKLSPKIQPDGKNSFKKADEMIRLAYKKGSHKFEWIHTKKNGDDFPVEVLLTTIHNEPNNKVIYCVWRDITERKKAELIIKESEHNLLEAQKIAKIGSFNLYLKTRIAKTSVNFNKIVGIDSDRVLTFALWRTITHPEDTPINRKALKKCLKTGEKFDLVYRILTKDTQELKWIHGLGEVIYKNGEPTNFFGTIQDITQKKRDELILKESEQNLLLAQEIANIGSFNLDFKTKIIKSSPIFDAITNITSIDNKNHEYYRSIIHPDDLPFNDKLFSDCIKTGQQYSSTYRIKIKETKELRWIIEKGRFNYKNGKLISFSGIIQDITTQKRDELNLQKAYAEVEQLKNQLEMENVSLKEEIALSFSYEDMIYSSQEISDVLTQVEQVSCTNATVLILGETGTGKELIAKAIHNTSDRKNNSLIRVNCAAIPYELVESELFGHIKGSFTGAINNRIGKFELADGGTLFLDEIGEMPLALQPKLLRAIQEGEIEPIGSSEIRKLDVRIVAASNKNLKKEVEEKRFREDLYFRLNVFPITIPPLRERIDDIPVLIDHFVNKYCKRHRKEIKHISDLTLQQMKSYSWPGNVRELENLIERAVIISNHDLLVVQEFESSPQSKTIIKHSSTALVEVQRNHIIKILNETQWKIDGKEGAAVLLDIKPSTLRDRMKKFGIVRS